MKIKLIILGSILSLATINSHAVNFTLQTGITIGGDAFIDTGNDNDLTAGDAFYFGGAVDFDINDKSIIRLGVSLREGESEFSDATEEFSTTQTELLYLKTHNNMFFGGGISLHKSPEYKIDVDGLGTIKQNFDDAFGFVGQLGYLFYNHELGGRIEVVDFEADSDSFDGNSIGFYYAYRFK